MSANDRHFEVLHLMLRQANDVYSLTRDSLIFLFKKFHDTGVDKYFVREYSEVDDHPSPASGNVQPKSYLDLGYNLQPLIERVIRGRDMQYGITGFHGDQCKLLFKHRASIWEDPELKTLMSCDAVKEFPEYDLPVKNLPLLWDAIAECHRILHLPAAELDEAELEARILDYRLCISKFVDRPGNFVPKPFRYKIKSYDHILIHHMMPEVRYLKSLGFSPVNMSSRYLEASNKDVKALAKRLSGGGVARWGGNHLPLVQLFKRLSARYKIERIILYQELEAKLVVEERQLQVEEEFETSPQPTK